MIQVRKAEDRGHFDYGWLNTRHTFSFDQYYDPEFNPSETELDHFYQIWIVPEQRGLRPSYDQRAFPEEEGGVGCGWSPRRPEFGAVCEPQIGQRPDPDTDWLEDRG